MTERVYAPEIDEPVPVDILTGSVVTDLFPNCATATPIGPGRVVRLELEVAGQNPYPQPPAEQGASDPQ